MLGARQGCPRCRLISPRGEEQRPKERGFRSPTHQAWSEAPLAVGTEGPTCALARCVDSSASSQAY